MTLLSYFVILLLISPFLSVYISVCCESLKNIRFITTLRKVKNELSGFVRQCLGRRALYEVVVL